MSLIEPDLKTLEIRRHFAVPATRLYAAWTDPGQIGLWWGPDGFTTRVLSQDLRVGGQFEFEMIGPDGDSSLLTGVYRKLDPPTGLAFEIIDHCTASLPAEVTQSGSSAVTVTLTERENGTDLLLRHTRLEAGYANLADPAWHQSLEKLAHSLG
ncbi:MAG: SRPBCC domain-containing protein [Pseudomonadota bacterium]